MAIPSENHVSSFSSIVRKKYGLAALVAAILLSLAGWLFLPLGQGSTAYSQSPWLKLRIASGYPITLPADGESTTIYEASIDDCDFGVPIDSNGIFTVNYNLNDWDNTTDASFTYLDGELPDQPARFLLTSSSEPMLVLLEVEISYCPAGAVALMGVCSDPAYVNARCVGSDAFNFYDPEDDIQPSIQENNPDSAQSESANQEESATEQGRSEQTLSENEASSEMFLTELYDDLEEYLAGEGITAPTPGQLGTSGIAITTLLAGWIVLNQMAGTSTEKSFDAIKAWKKGERPPIGAEVDLPVDFEDGDAGIEVDLPDEVSEPSDPDETLVTSRTPVEESGEDRVLRGVKDAQDLDDALKQTRKDFEAFEGKVPDQVKNSEPWKKHVAPQIKKANQMIKKGELDKARTWLDRAEKLIELRKHVDRELDHLSADKRDAIVWTERGLKTLGHIATDTYQTAVIEPAKAAAEKFLPADRAKEFNQSLDEMGKELSKTAQGISELPRKGARRVSDGGGQDQLQQIIETDQAAGNREMAQDISDIRSFKDRAVPVEHFDPWGKGTKKAKELWDHTMRCLFHDR